MERLANAKRFSGWRLLLWIAALPLLWVGWRTRSPGLLAIGIVVVAPIYVQFGRRTRRCAQQMLWIRKRTKNEIHVCRGRHNGRLGAQRLALKESVAPPSMRDVKQALMDCLRAPDSFAERPEQILTEITARRSFNSLVARRRTQTLDSQEREWLDRAEQMYSNYLEEIDRGCKESETILSAGMARYDELRVPRSLTDAYEKLRDALRAEYITFSNFRGAMHDLDLARAIRLDAEVEPIGVRIHAALVSALRIATGKTGSAPSPPAGPGQPSPPAPEPH